MSSSCSDNVVTLTTGAPFLRTGHAFARVEVLDDVEPSRFLVAVRFADGGYLFTPCSYTYAQALLEARQRADALGVIAVDATSADLAGGFRNG